MEVNYKSNKLKKICTNPSEARKRYSKEMVDVISLRIDQLRAFDKVETMIRLGIGRCHPLHGNRKGQYAMDLVQPFRLVFSINGNEVEIVLVEEIVDYH